MARCFRSFWVSARTPPRGTILLALETAQSLVYTSWVALAVVSLPSVFVVSLLAGMYPATGLQQVLVDAHATDQGNRIQRGATSLISSLWPPLSHPVMSIFRMT